MHQYRIDEIREQSQSEDRTHEWADRVIDELLADAEAAQEIRTAAHTTVTALSQAVRDLPDSPVTDAYRQTAERLAALLARSA
ncbi:hypothetical protein [Streptomyces antibioticus]|uniref:hypothetical protein n=1 Tax=Streptomyces antibioticus TaxID=1890 RepID=UPI0036DB703D